MKTNYIKKDIIIICLLFLFFASVFALLTWHDAKTNSMSAWGSQLYNSIITE